jgi:membrane associated rhomboid family serine protease
MAAMDTRRMYTERMLLKKPLATHALLGVCAVFFVNQYMLDAFKVPYFGVLPWGANVPWDVMHGEYFRIAASLCVFGRPLQFVMHMMALLQVAVPFERVVGPLRMGVVFLLCALCGNAVDALWGHTVVGTGVVSGVWGLLAAFATLHVRFKKDRPVGLWRPVRWWVFTCVLCVLLPTLWPLTLDVYGPAVAVALGVVLGLLMRVHALLARPVWFKDGLWTPACAVLVGVLAVSLGLAVRMAAHPAQGPSADFGRRVLQAQGLDPRVLSALAWVLVTEPESTSEQLQSALLLARKGLEGQPQDPEAIDVLGTAYYRLNRFEEAIQEEHRALNKEPLSYYATQLGRFMVAQWQLSGAAVHVSGLGLQDVVLRLEPDKQHTWKAVLRLSERARKMATRKGLVVMGVLVKGKQSLGMVRVLVYGEQVPAVAEQVLEEVDLSDVSGEQPSLRMGVTLQREADVAVPEPPVSWYFWPPDVTAEMLP